MREVQPVESHDSSAEQQPEAPSFSSQVRRFMLSSVLCVYMGGTMISIPYFNWCYARDNGFFSWLFLGEIIATAQAVVWPYYALSGKSKPDWSDSERDNLEHFRRSTDAIQQAVRIVNAGPTDRPSMLTPEEANAVAALQKVALTEARKVDLEVLAKAHPELPQQFRDKYLRHLELTDQHSNGNASVADQMEAQTLFNDWIDWFNANLSDIHMPKRRPK